MPTTHQPHRKRSRAVQVQPDPPSLTVEEQVQRAEQERTRIDKAAMLKALAETLMIVTAACEKAGVARSTYYKWLNEDAEFAQATVELQPIALDFAEAQLFQNMKAGKEASTIFYLKTKGRERGYVERKEITGANGGAIELQGNMAHLLSVVSEELPREAILSILDKGQTEHEIRLPKPIEGKVVATKPLKKPKDKAA